MAIRSLIAALAVLVVTPPAQGAGDAWTRHADAARVALARSVQAGYLSAADEGRYRGILAHARVVSRRVPPLRAEVLAAVLAQVAEPASPPAPRALELYTTLQENADYLDTHRVPPAGVDVPGRDGAVYRAVTGLGLQFHPLANAAALNALVARGDREGARALADALAARAVPEANGALVWEYRFPFGTQRPGWTSGMAQAVLAQALARAGRLDLARRAFAAIPGALERRLPAGPWIRLYSESGVLVLNAQLQSAISIADYAGLAGDGQAAAYATALLGAAKAMLPRFDTGHWSRYALGDEADLHYQDYVISLLTTIGKRTGDPAWADAAARFQLYETQPPRLTGASVPDVVYPRPADGVRDDVAVRFWLSKPAKVVLVVDGEAVDGRSLHGGWHAFHWTRPTLALGDHAVRLVARDANGNPGAAEAGTFAVERDRTPPELAATKADGRVFWHAGDGESACCRIRIELRGGGGRETIVPAGPRRSARIPAGYWSVTVVAGDEAGNVTEKALGLVVGRRTD